jgi:hypothetical protein
MTIRKAITRAVTENNAVMAGRIADFLRFKHGLNYDQIQKMFFNITGISAAQFEGLMYEADYQSSYG